MFTKLEQRSWLKLKQAGAKQWKSYWGLDEACGTAALPYRTVARWVQAFRCRPLRPDHQQNRGCQGIMRLPHRWERVLHNFGEYIEGLWKYELCRSAVSKVTAALPKLKFQPSYFAENCPKESSKTREELWAVTVLMSTSCNMWGRSSRYEMKKSRLTRGPVNVVVGCCVHDLNEVFASCDSVLMLLIHETVWNSQYRCFSSPVFAKNLTNLSVNMWFILRKFYGHSAVSATQYTKFDKCSRVSSRQSPLASWIVLYSHVPLRISKPLEGIRTR